MGSFFRGDTPFAAFITKFADLVLLNLLWLLGCIPVVTIGASTTALYQCVMELRKDPERNVLEAFWAAFRSNFKTSTLVFLIVAVFLCLLAFDVYLVLFTRVGENVLVVILTVVALIQVMLSVGYIFPLQAQFACGLLQTIKNAWLMAFLHIPTSVLVLAINAVPVLLFLFALDLFVKSIMVWMLGGCAVIAWLNTMLLQRVFRRYMPRQEDCPEEQREDTA